MTRTRLFVAGAVALMGVVLVTGPTTEKDDREQAACRSLRTLYRLLQAEDRGDVPDLGRLEAGFREVDAKLRRAESGALEAAADAIQAALQEYRAALSAPRPPAGSAQEISWAANRVHAGRNLANVLGQLSAVCRLVGEPVG